jgi:hypothetical protein
MFHRSDGGTVDDWLRLALTDDQVVHSDELAGALD